jgi:hypothetical protein
MNGIIRSLFAAAVVATLTVSSASAQQQVIRVIGMIERVDGSMLVVKTRQGGDPKMSVTVADNVKVLGVAKASLSDIKPGTFVGIGAMPQADGSQRAVQISIFSESMRGDGEGHRPWTSTPGGTMTNATVDTSVTSVDGPVLMVKYKGGEKKITVGTDATIRVYADGARSELKPGADIILRAVKRPDGTLEAAQVEVGRDGFVPQ